jgi:hypothetical protein
MGILVPALLDHAGKAQASHATLAAYITTLSIQSSILQAIGIQVPAVHTELTSSRSTASVT